jgi:hypothetical protein
MLDFILISLVSALAGCRVWGDMHGMHRLHPNNSLSKVTPLA